jgi:hypothetical protein
MNGLAELCFSIAAMSFALLLSQLHVRVIQWLTGSDEVRA